MPSGCQTLMPLKKPDKQPCIVTLGATLAAVTEPITGTAMQDVKVRVRVNVGVDAASAILWLASATIGLILYRQYRQDRRDRQALAARD